MARPSGSCVTGHQEGTQEVNELWLRIVGQGPLEGGASGRSDGGRFCQLQGK
jgi:hypothetical protein